MMRKLVTSTIFIGTLALMLFGRSIPSRAQVLFSDDFSSGNFSKWMMVWQTSRWSIVPSPTDPSNLVARVYYTNSSTGHVDDNEMLIASVSGIRHLFARGYVYFPADLPLSGSTGTNINRKLIYFKSENYGNADNNYWAAVLGMDSSLTLSFGASGNGWVPLWNVGKLPGLGQWVCLEVELDATPPPGSQVFRLWINGNLSYEATNLTLTKTTDTLGTVEFGRQIDFVNNSTSEYRYWDDIALSTSYIGPTSSSGTQSSTSTSGTQPTSSGSSTPPLNPPTIKVIN